MSYHFADHLILRLPAYPVTSYSAEPETILKTPFIQAALYLASPAFYERLKASGFNPTKLSTREMATVMKYYNRCCFRPTPFGLFASVSLVAWGKGPMMPTGPNSLSAILQPDQTYVNRISGKIIPVNRFEVKFESNRSLYRVLKDYRFISTEVDENGKRNYQLQSTDYSLVLKDILLYCRQPRSKVQVIQHICLLANTTEEDSEDYFLFLSGSQILIPDTRMNLTGKNYLNRIINGMSDQVQTTGHSSINLVEDFPFSRMTVPDLLNYRKKLKHFSKEEMTDNEGQEISAVLLRRMTRSQLHSSFQKIIRDGIDAINKLCPPDELPAMNQFRSAFLKYFEGQRIPLLEALDPERGIGYQEPTAEHPNELLKTIKLHPAYSVGPKNPWTPAHAYLMECWMATERKQVDIIRLEAEGLHQLSSSDEMDTPLGISVLFRIAGGKVFLEAAGGNNALALVGRFSASDSDIADAARRMAKEQEGLNASLVFAELLHLADPHIDNVNRREHIWSYELPITAASTLPAGKQLALDNLFIEISGDKVLLWSEKHKKYVIPRLTTAYNHNINQLPLFRFLADLSYQFGRAHLNFQLRYFFPGLSYYPRVEFQNCILSPATWIITETTLMPFRELTGEELKTAFATLVKQLKLPEFFALTDGDQQLVFKRDSLKEMLLFKEVTRQRTELQLTEYMVEKADGALVYDEAGQPFINQFNAFLLPDRPLALPKGQGYAISTATKARRFMLGSEWLYLKIYSPKLGASKLLLKIWPLIQRRYTNARIGKWFFIRYDDHAPHIRLRLKINPLDLSEILLAFRALLEDHIQQHVIREYQLDVYSRELERYQAGGIELTEDFFWASSLFVMQYLRRSKIKNAPPVFLVAVSSIKLIADELLPDDAEQKEFFRECYLKMLNEFDGKKSKHQLDIKYREFSQTIYDVLHDDNFLQTHRLAGARLNLEMQVVELKRVLPADSDDLHPYLQSIMHMHLNRLFTDQQRMQEMIIYFLLFKHLNAEEARRKNRH